MPQNATDNSIETRTRLNELVAEKIFGEAKPSKSEHLRYGQIAISSGRCYEARPRPGGSYRGFETDWVADDFSGDIAQAWRVVEKMQQQNYLMTVNVYRRFYCEIYFNNHYFCVARDTAPEAICRAALAAVGCEVKE